jgi:urease accessory protein
MLDVPVVLALMQYGDSAFPAGGFAFSWGLEGLAADCELGDREDVDDVIAEHLTFRWQTMDRPLLVQTYRAPDLDAVVTLDRYCTAATLSAEMREGSRRAGRALLGTAARLGGDLSREYQTCLKADGRLGNLPVAQSLAFRDAGLDLEAARLLSGWTLITGLVSAAIRLGLIGHIEAQHSLDMARGRLATLLADTSSDDAMPSSFTPLIDIAISRGPARDLRLFST